MENIIDIMSLEQDTAAFLERLEETTEEVEGIIAQLDLIDERVGFIPTEKVCEDISSKLLKNK